MRWRDDAPFEMGQESGFSAAPRVTDRAAGMSNRDSRRLGHG
jgi:hypothetical protein